MTSTGRRLERLLLRAMPAGSREALMGDAREEGVSSGADILGFYLPIAVRYHADSYRDVEDRLAILGLAALALGVLWAVPAAAAGTFPDPAFFPDPFLRLVATLWSTSHVTSAAAAGLLIGRLPVVAEHAAPARSHVGLGCAGTCLVINGDLASGGAAALILVVGGWLGSSARRLTPVPRPPHQLT